MKVEVVDFYPFSKHIVQGRSKAIGTMHIYIEEFNMDLKGILVRQRGKRYFFFLPSQLAIDAETKEKVRYPLISLLNEKKHKDMTYSIQKAGEEFFRNQEN